MKEISQKNVLFNQDKFLKIIENDGFYRVYYKFYFNGDDIVFEKRSATWILHCDYPDEYVLLNKNKRFEGFSLSGLYDMILEEVEKYEMLDEIIKTIKSSRIKLVQMVKMSEVILPSEKLKSE